MVTVFNIPGVHQAASKPWAVLATMATLEKMEAPQAVSLSLVAIFGAAAKRAQQDLPGYLYLDAATGQKRPWPSLTAQSDMTAAHYRKQRDGHLVVLPERVLSRTLAHRGGSLRPQASTGRLEEWQIKYSQLHATSLR